MKQKLVLVFIVMHKKLVLNMILQVIKLPESFV